MYAKQSNNQGQSVQPLHGPGPVFPQFSQYSLEALYRYQTSMRTVRDEEQLAYDLELAECEQN